MVFRTPELGAGRAITLALLGFARPYWGGLLTPLVGIGPEADDCVGSQSSSYTGDSLDDYSASTRSSHKGDSLDDYSASTRSSHEGDSLDDYSASTRSSHSRHHMGLGRFSCPCGRNRLYLTGPLRGPLHPTRYGPVPFFLFFVGSRPAAPPPMGGGGAGFASSPLEVGGPGLWGTARPLPLFLSPPPPLPRLALKLNQAVQRGADVWSNGYSGPNSAEVEQRVFRTQLGRVEQYSGWSAVRAAWSKCRHSASTPLHRCHRQNLGWPAVLTGKKKRYALVRPEPS